MRSVLPLVAFAPLVLAACGGANAAGSLAKLPAYLPKDQTKCSVEKSQSKPLIVEWPSADRGELETHAHSRGLVVVRYEGCDMQVLDRCTAPVKYGYEAMTRKKDRVVMRDADDLYANVPVGAAKLEGKLEKSGELDVDMTLVGRWEAERTTVRADELEGDCSGATHVVYALTVGSFTFTSGADATVGAGATVLGAGGGATSSAKRETIDADGDESSCEKSTPDDKTPPANCGALLRLEVVPLSGAKTTAAAAAPSPAATTPPSPAATTRAATNTDATGGWDFRFLNGDSWVTTSMHCQQQGQRVTCQYAGGGTAEGTIVGHTLTGTWNNGGQGRWQVTFSDDWMTFSGSWGAMTGALSYPESGQRRAPGGT